MPRSNSRVTAGSSALCLVTEELQRAVPPGLHYPYPPDLPVLVDHRHQILLGSSRVWSHQVELPARVVRPDPTQRHHLRTLDCHSSPAPSCKAHAASALRALGLTLRQVQTILHLTDPGTTSRWVRIATLPPRVLHALDKGQIQFGHARYLIGLAPATAVELLEQCLGFRWTVQMLRAAVAGSLPSSAGQAAADIASFADRVSQQLGAAVRIAWPDNPAGRRIAIAWYDVETLRGLLGRLAEGTETFSGEPLRRELVIAVRNADELDALLSHLAQ